MCTHSLLFCRDVEIGDLVMASEVFLTYVIVVEWWSWWGFVKWEVGCVPGGSGVE